MYKVDNILGMLDSDNTIEIQKEGLRLAKNIKYLEVFCRPANKKCWKNCANVICARNDDELLLYITELFEWISDLNNPGAEIIINRLNTCERNEMFLFFLKLSLDKANRLKKMEWKNTLNKFLI